MATAVAVRLTQFSQGPTCFAFGYDVDEIRAEPFPSGHTSRSWGRLIRRPDGRVEDEPWPWPDSAK